MSAEEWQKQIANLTPAQRVGIVAAVALSCFALYATKNHRDICGGPLDSPRHRANCPLAFLNCAPSNDINESIATIADTIKDFDAAAWELPAMPRIPPMPQLPGLPPKLELLLGCPHDEVLAVHPHGQSCLQCKELRRCSNLLERAYMDWDTEETITTPLLRCPHNERISPHNTACGRCAERSYTNELERGRMSNWTADHFVEGEGYVIGSLSSSDSASSLESLLASSPEQLLPPQLASVADEMSRGAMAVVAEAERNMAEVRHDVAVMSGSASMPDPRDSVSTAAMAKSTVCMILWYLISLCNDK